MENFKHLRKVSASMNHEKFKLFMLKALMVYHKSLELEVPIGNGIESLIVETLAHHWGYAASFNDQIDEFAQKFVSFVMESKNKNQILNELNNGMESRKRQDYFLTNHKHYYIIKKGSVNLITPTGNVEINCEKFQSSYPSNSFKNRLIYEKLEVKTLETFKEITQILDDTWAILLVIGGGMCSWNDRDFGLEPSVQICTARVEGGMLFNEEVCLAKCALPVTLNMIYTVADDLACHPDEDYRTPQFYEMKRIVSSHYLKEDLTARLPVKESTASSRGRAAKI